MGKVELESIYMYAKGEWSRLHGVDNQSNVGQIYKSGYWRGFWPPDDGIYHNGDWYTKKDSGSTNPPEVKPPVAEKTVNKVRIRRQDWTPSPGVFRFGLSVELTYPPKTQVFGQLKIKKGEKELSFDYRFDAGDTPYHTYKSNEEANFDTIKFVSGTVYPAEDSSYKYEFAHKKDDIIK